MMELPAVRVRRIDLLLLLIVQAVFDHHTLLALQPLSIVESESHANTLAILQQ